MLMQEERELVVEYGKKMSAARLSTGTSGNISIYNAEQGLVAIEPLRHGLFFHHPGGCCDPGSGRQGGGR